MSLLSLLIAAGAVLLVVHGLRSPGRRRWPGQKRPGGIAPVAPAAPEWSYDAADQLRTVMNASFTKRRLMSHSEYQVFRWTEQAIRAQKRPWRVMAQVSLGEVLSSPDDEAYFAINSKRVDILVISRTGDPVVALEFQGDGHWQGTASARDAVKKEALRRAGVGYIEVTPQHNAEDVAREIARLPIDHPQREGA